MLIRMLAVWLCRILGYLGLSNPVCTRWCPCIDAVFATAGKKTVNVGRQGGAAGLDDYIYNESLDDDYDFM